MFSQFLEPLDFIMEQPRKQFNWTRRNGLLYMSGSVSVKTRMALMVDFNDLKSEVKVMLASTKVHGEGITLFGTSCVVLLNRCCVEPFCQKPDDWMCILNWSAKDCPYIQSNHRRNTREGQI